MKFDKLFTWIIGIVAAYAISGNLDVFQRWVIHAGAKLIYESRTETWGSPRIFETHK